MNSLDTFDSSPDAPARDTPNVLVEHFFRHQSGRLISTLTRVLGVKRLDLVEDVVQAAFLQALRSWSVRGIPDDPAGWLFRVAKNHALDIFRKERAWEETARPMMAALAIADDALLARVQLADEIEDDQLRLLCLCCHPALPPESQVAFALKMLGGFSTEEIARALLTTAANAQKRVARAKERLRKESIEELTSHDLSTRLPNILSVIYLLFNEGYLSCSDERMIRADICGEALRLGGMLTDHPLGRTPTSCALMALMSLHAARFEAREGDDGCILLMDRQDRRKWDGKLIGAGVRWLSEAAKGDIVSPYHIEAGIASEHCLASTFHSTNWSAILDLYDLLVQMQPTWIHKLNRGIAIAYVHGASAALRELALIEPEEIPSNYHLWDAALGELHRRAGNQERARHHLNRALEGTSSSAEKGLLRERIAATSSM